MENSPKTLRTLTQALDGSSSVDSDILIAGLAVDSREVKPGYLFAAMPGTKVHGAEFITYALRMGAVAVLTDAEGLEYARQNGLEKVPFVVADNPRLALSKIAARYFDAQPETIVAVTGTNGKTSVASFLRQIWEHLGLAAVNFGTAGVEGAVSARLTHTTPEPITLHHLLADLAAQGVTHAAMEASSHGLAQYRLDGVRLKAAGFTNLSRDHMDFHDGFADYFAAKSALFTRVLPESGVAVINTDDPYGQRLAANLNGVRNCITLGQGEGADIGILNTRFRPDGQDILVRYQGENRLIALPLIGGFQASNVMVAAGLAIASGSEPAAVFDALPYLQTVRGRMQHVATRKNGATVYVDYAHTPDALETVLKALRPHVMGRLVVVFGAGGDRDKGKRPLMGQAAAEFADVVFVTDDNPRTEDAATIRAEVMAGCPRANEIGDRAHAILAGVDALQPGDTLLIAGKGHETGQIVGQDILPFDDAEQASISVAALEQVDL